MNQKTESKEKQYEHFAFGLSSSDTVRKNLKHIRSDDFLFDSPRNIKNYFKQHNLPYNSAEDITLLSIYLAKALDDVNGSETEKIIRREQEQELILQFREACSEKDTLLSKIDKLAKPLEDISFEIYSILKNRPFETVLFGNIDGTQTGHLSYQKRKKSIRYGVCGREYTKWSKKNDSNYGFEIVITSGWQNKPKKNIKIYIPVGEKNITISGFKDFLDRVKSELNQGRGEFELEYIQTMFNFQKALCEKLTKSQDALKLKVNTLLTDIIES
ncbi:hypothetical protein HOK51_01290 [Candidatus Woesearchaeota archaeon]|jgi:hypothetical protein|nr:hypothetical protein [Candidatus Woesearchaeota archaeon]MBT6518448.1 hypothetical protein [Candidatus Woesearchaeota archaeon]MBT7366929.1 hypothetical protein [Candidatus Woesearchaeota archaeon]